MSCGRSEVRQTSTPTRSNEGKRHTAVLHFDALFPRVNQPIQRSRLAANRGRRG